MVEKYKFDSIESELVYTDDTRCNVSYAGNGFLIVPWYSSVEYDSRSEFIGAEVYYYGALLKYYVSNKNNVYCVETQEKFMELIAEKIFKGEKQ